MLRRVLRLEPFGDLLEARVPGDERRAAGGSGLGGDHPERLGEDRRDDRGVRERQQVDEVAVLEGAGEERPRRRGGLELGPVVAEADDHGLRLEPLQRLEQQVDALVPQELPEVDDRRAFGLEEGGETVGVPLVRQALVGVSRVRRVPARLVEQGRERLLAHLGPPLVHVDAGRHLVHAVDVTDDLLDDPADVRGADEDGFGAGERLPPPRGELRVSAHRVLELGAVRLDRVAGAAGGGDRPAEQDVVREDEVGRQVSLQRFGVELDVALALLRREVREKARLEPLVAVEHEHRQDPADLGPDRVGAAQVVLLGPRLLREDDDVVAFEAPLARERPRVDVRPRPAEQVPVPEKNPQRPSLPSVSAMSGARPRPWPKGTILAPCSTTPLSSSR